MKSLFVIVLCCGALLAQTNAPKKSMKLSDAFARAGLKSLYAIRDRAEWSYEALETAEVESDKPAETLMLNNLRAFDLSLSLLSQVELFTFQAGIGQKPLPAAPRDKVSLASECYQILQTSFRSHVATEWPKACELKP